MTWLTAAAAFLALMAVLVWPGPAATAGQESIDDVLGDGEAGQDHGPSLLTRLRRLAGGRRRSQAALEVAVLDSMASALEAGLPTERAVHLALAGGQEVPGWAELRRAAAEGQALAPVWVRVSRRTGSPTAAAVARAWSVAARSGAPLADAVRSSAHAARERHRLQRAVQVATAGARATALVLTLLPLAGWGLAAALGIGPAQMVASPMGLASVAAGVVLLLVGHVVVRRLVSTVLQAAR